MSVSVSVSVSVYVFRREVLERELVEESEGACRRGWGERVSAEIGRFSESDLVEPTYSEEVAFLTHPHVHTHKHTQLPESDLVEPTYGE